LLQLTVVVVVVVVTGKWDTQKQRQATSDPHCWHFDLKQRSEKATTAKIAAGCLVIGLIKQNNYAKQQ